MIKMADLNPSIQYLKCKQGTYELKVKDLSECKKKKKDSIILQPTLNIVGQVI